MKILIVEDESDLRDIICFMLESRFGAQALEAASGQQAIEVIRQNPDIDCVVSDYRMEGGTGGDVFNYVRQQHPSMKFILSSSGMPEEYPEFKDRKPDAHFQKPFTADQLAAGIREVLGLDSGTVAVKLAKFCRIRTVTILKVDLLNCDLYIKLSENKYVKVLNSGDVFAEADVMRYGAKSIDYLYVRAEESHSFLEKFSKDVWSISRAKEAIPHDTAMLITKSTLEVVHEVTGRLGFTREVQELTKASVELALRCIRDDPQLNSLLAKLAVDPDSYISSHSSVLAHVSCGIATQMTWNSESTRHKLALASFLHDMTHESNDIAMEGDLNGVEAVEARFGEKGKAEFLRHPEEAARLARVMSEMPPDVDAILQQHHERPDSTGFPYQSNYRRLSPLSSVFIMSHELVTKFFQNPEMGPPDLQGYLRETEKLYSVGHFKKIHAVLKTTLK